MDNEDIASDDVSSPNISPESIHDYQKEENVECRNEEKAYLNQKHHIIFKPHCSPVSSRLRNKKKLAD